MTQINVELTEEMKRFAEQEAHARGFNTVSDYLNYLLQQRCEELKLQAAIDEGLASGRGRKMSDADWNDLHKQLDERIARKVKTS
ncbi:MAG TPA: hypothetical protein VEK08_06100 [Planctomycetota bacterium]|nr:hypothetical protein [Planctomycetota bacterium]